MSAENIPREGLIDYYGLEERGGNIVFIEAHKRVTARMVAARYDVNPNAVADSWNVSEVAVWTDDADVIDDIAASIPERDIITEIRASEPERVEQVDGDTSGDGDFLGGGPTAVLEENSSPEDFFPTGCVLCDNEEETHEEHEEHMEEAHDC